MNKELLESYFKKNLFKYSVDVLRKLAIDITGNMNLEKNPKKETIVNYIVESVFDSLRQFPLLSYFVNRVGALALSLENPIFKHSILKDIATSFNNELQMGRSNLPPPHPQLFQFADINLKNGDCLCYQNPGSKKSGDTMSCVNSDCRRQFHASCMKIKSAGEQKSFECPRCFLKKCDPLHRVESVLLEPFLIRRKTENFIIDTDSWRRLERGDYIVEVRCIRVEEKIYYEQTYPDLCDLFVNERRLYDFKPLQKNSALKKRKDEKMNVKDFIRPGSNSIRFDMLRPSAEQKQLFRIEEDANHICGVYLIRVLQPHELVEFLKANSLVSEQDCRSKIKSLLNNSENDVSVDKISVNINDPIDALPMKTPCRGRFCTHQQCFSLENFVSMTKQSSPRKWKCPICKIKAFELKIDGLQQKILQRILTERLNVCEITFLNDGNYHLEPEKPIKSDRSNEESPKRVQVAAKQPEKKAAPNKEQVIILDEDEEEIMITNEKALPGPNQSPQSLESLSNAPYILDHSCPPISPEKPGIFEEKEPEQNGENNERKPMDIEFGVIDGNDLDCNSSPCEIQGSEEIKQITKEDEQIRKLTEEMFKERMKQLDIHSKLREMSNYEDFKSNSCDIRTRDTKFNYQENAKLQKILFTVIYKELLVTETECELGEQSSKKKAAKESSAMQIESEEKTLNYFSEKMKKSMAQATVSIDVESIAAKSANKSEKGGLSAVNGNNGSSNLKLIWQSHSVNSEKLKTSVAPSSQANSKNNPVMMPSPSSSLVSPHNGSKPMNTTIPISTVNLPVNGGIGMNMGNSNSRPPKAGPMNNQPSNGTAHPTQILFPQVINNIPVYPAPNVSLPYNLGISYHVGIPLEKQALPEEKRTIPDKLQTNAYSTFMKNENNKNASRAPPVNQRVPGTKNKGKMAEDPICID